MLHTHSAENATAHLEPCALALAHGIRSPHAEGVLWQPIPVLFVGREVRWPLFDLWASGGDRAREWMVRRLFCRRLGRLVLQVP